MKRVFGIIAACWCLLLALTVHAAEDSASIIVLTYGDDHYSDGTPVLDGETYILVWQKKNTTFQGFHEDCTLVDTVNSAILSDNGSVWKATGKRLPEVSWDFDKTYLTTGTLSLYVTDTRRYSATYAYNDDGNISSVTTNITLGGTSSVQGYAEVAGYVEFYGNYGGMEGNEVGGYLLSLLDDTIIPAPVISGMSIQGDTVILKVKSTKASVTYNLVGGETLGEAKATHDPSVKGLAPISGGSTLSDEIEIRTKRDPKATSAFFKIVRSPLKK